VVCNLHFGTAYLAVISESVILGSVSPHCYRTYRLFMRVFSHPSQLELGLVNLFVHVIFLNAC